MLGVNNLMDRACHCQDQLRFLQHIHFCADKELASDSGPKPVAQRFEFFLVPGHEQSPGGLIGQQFGADAPD